jgi:hypothetical protein
MTDPLLIKESVVLSEVIGQYVKLRKSYGNSGRWIGLCPFHQEKNPSFCVDDSIGRFKCFSGSCGEHGDVIEFLQRMHNSDYKAALKEVKLLGGIEDEWLSPGQRKAAEIAQKAALAERKAFRKWKDELVSNLIHYTSLEWEIHHKARRQLLSTWTEELEQQAEFARTEAERKERALDGLELMSDHELMGWYKTRKSWEGAANPPFVLSGKRLEMVKKAKAAK